MIIFQWLGAPLQATIPQTPVSFFPINLARTRDTYRENINRSTMYDVFIRINRKFPSIVQRARYLPEFPEPWRSSFARLPRKSRKCQRREHVSGVRTTWQAEEDGWKKCIDSRKRRVPTLTTQGEELTSRLRHVTRSRFFSSTLLRPKFFHARGAREQLVKETSHSDREKNAKLD